MAYTRRLRVDNGAWKDLAGGFSDPSSALGAGYSAAVMEITKGAYQVEFQILLDGVVVFQTPYATQPHPLPPRRESGPIKAFTVTRKLG